MSWPPSLLWSVITFLWALHPFGPAKKSPAIITPIHLKSLQLHEFLASFCQVTCPLCWPRKKIYSITYKLSLGFRIIKTTLYVPGDFSKKGQIWHGFDDSEVTLGHQRNILTISGHSNVISTHFRQETVERLLSLGEWMGVLKMTRWNLWFDIFT